MNKILFPTDFSKIAENALDFAIEIANQQQGQLTIAHAYKPSHTVVQHAGLNLKRQASKRIDSLITSIQPRLAKGVTVNSVVMRANPLPFLAHLSKTADLIVMGTQNIHNWIAALNKRISSNLARQTQTPLLVIPELYAYRPFRKVVLSIDEQSVSKPAIIQPLKDLVKGFHAELTLFHTEEKAADLGIHEEVLAYMGEEVGYTVDYNFVQKSVPKSIEDMVIDYDVDLLGLIRRKRDFWNNLFHHSVTNHEILNSKIPILILHDV